MKTLLGLLALSFTISAHADGLVCSGIKKGINGPIDFSFTQRDTKKNEADLKVIINPPGASQAVTLIDQYAAIKEAGGKKGKAGEKEITVEAVSDTNAADTFEADLSLDGNSGLVKLTIFVEGLNTIRDIVNLRCHKSK